MNESDLKALIANYCNGTLSDAEFALLQEELRANLIAKFVRKQVMHKLSDPRGEDQRLGSLQVHVAVPGAESLGDGGVVSRQASSLKRGQ